MKKTENPTNIKTNIYLDKIRLQKLKTISAETMVPMAALIRKGIDLVIAEYSGKKKTRR